MDPRRVLLFSALLACALGASPSSFKNARDMERPDLARRARRIGLNEYLVPPPPPKFPPGRTARLVPPTESGYFSKLMSWLNPFNYVPSSQSPPLPPPPPPPPRLEAHPHQPKFIQPPPPLPPISGSSASGYGDSSPPIYDRPPLPPIFNHHSTEHHAPKRNCNPCDKVPWVPINADAPHHSSADASFVAAPSLPSLPLQSSPSGGGYLPPQNPSTHDAYHAASQQVRAPDLSFAPPSSTASQNAALLSPLPSPQLYPGASPPLFQATDFNYPVQLPTLGGIAEYLDAAPPSGNDPLLSNDVFPTVAASAPNNAHLRQNIYPSGSWAHSSPGLAHQDFGYTPTGASNSGLGEPHVQSLGGHGDLFSSGSQVTQGHAVDPAVNAQKFDDTVGHHRVTLGPTDQRGFFGGLAVADHQSLGAGAGAGDLLDNSSRIVPNPPSNYGISGLDRPPNNYEHRYNDLSSSSSVVTDSHAPPRAADGSAAKIEDPIHFEESPLLDLTHKGESRTDLSPIPPTSNALTDSNESAETGRAATTLPPGVELFGVGGVPGAPAYTESRFPANGLLKTIELSGSLDPDKSNSIDESANAQVASGVYHGPRTEPGEQKVSYFQSLSHSLTGYFRPDVSSTTSRSTERGSFWGSSANVYVDGQQAEYDGSAENVDVDAEDTNDTRDVSQQGPKRNKKVQVIIPYTSKHTPVPFQPVREQNYGRKVSYRGDSGRDNYVSEESRSKIKVTDLPVNPSRRKHPQTWQNATVAISEEVTGKPAAGIKEYSKGTTASTISPSSAKTYLFPSKQIPDKYLTTTEPIDHADDSRNVKDESVKSFTLGGFSFNDQKYEASSSNRVEGPRIQVTKRQLREVGEPNLERSSATPPPCFLFKVIIGDKDQHKVSSEGSVDIVTARTINDHFTWQGFPMDFSLVSKERVYVVTPQPVVTTPRTTTTMAVERSPKTSTEASEVDTDTGVITNRTDPFESIEKAYQVLPQAVNNLAVASTGPDSVPLWGIMEHEEFGSLGDSDQDDHEDEAEIPVLYEGHSKACVAVGRNDLSIRQEQRLVALIETIEANERRLGGRKQDFIFSDFILRTEFRKNQQLRFQNAFGVACQAMTHLHGEC
ncbi:hypothetical protein EAI_14590 [Harpegnathos saltator]|uniref:Uncharacterized protein n=1 Tax=Harpegnathos saltator TaxID=610380 RepID=E2BFX3_HARSA|nr:hypothetical protein EAI_14590 [Harpegnathos saltator]